MSLFRIVYSPVNCAHFVLFGDAVLRIFAGEDSLKQAEAYLDEIRDRAIPPIPTGPTDAV